MAKLPTTTRIPWKYDDVASGDPERLAKYLKSLVKALMDIYTEIANAVNLGGGGSDTYHSSMSGNETFEDPNTMNRIYFLDPNGANRNFNPSGDFSDGFTAIVKNVGTGGNKIIFDSSGLATDLYNDRTGFFWYNGTAGAWEK